MGSRQRNKMHNDMIWQYRQRFRLWTMKVLPSMSDQ